MNGFVGGDILHRTGSCQNADFQPNQKKSRVAWRDRCCVFYSMEAVISGGTN